MNIRKIDEGKAIIADLNTDMTFASVKRLIDIPVSKEEVEYMKDNWKPHEIQIRLINSYYAHYFGNYRDTNLSTRDEFYYMAILLKKKLLIEAGWERDEDGVIETSILPYILTGNLMGRANNRIIRNNKYMNKLEEDIHYQLLCEDEFSLMLEIHPDEIKQYVSTLVNNSFTYVTPEYPELTGRLINCNEDKIGAETIFFLFNSDVAA